MYVGDIEVVPLSDGYCRLPPGFFSDSSWSDHAGLPSNEGIAELPIGCFLVRTGRRTVLVDAGLGPRRLEWSVGGELPAALAAVGVAPADIDTVVCTHLHLDHAGWLVDGDEPFFAKATVRFGAQDWQRWVEEAPASDRVRQAMLVLDSRHRLDPISRDGEAIAPGITARAAPGHTLGHHVVVLSSGDQRLLLLGDSVICPVQLQEEDWEAMSDMDPTLARRTRDALWAELEGTSTSFTAAHFPGLQFGRVMRGAGRRYFAAGSVEP